MPESPSDHGGIAERWVNLVTGEEAAVCHDGTILVHIGWRTSSRALNRDPAWKQMPPLPGPLRGRQPGKKVKTKKEG